MYWEFVKHLICVISFKYHNKEHRYALHRNITNILPLRHSREKVCEKFTQRPTVKKISYPKRNLNQSIMGPEPNKIFMCTSLQGQETIR